MDSVFNVIKLHDKKIERMNLDCVAFCRVPGFENYLLCAKYQLDQSSGNVDGGFILYDTTMNTLKEVFQEDSEGVFDLMWLPEKMKEKVCFAIAYACPKIGIYSFSAEEGVKQVAVKTFEGKFKFLYLDLLVIGEVLHIVATDDQERVHYVRVDNDLIFKQCRS